MVLTYPKIHVLSNLSARHGKLPFKLLIRSLQGSPKFICTIIIVPCCLPELEGKDLMAGCTTGLQGIKLELSWKPPY